MSETQLSDVLDRLGAVNDMMTVRKVFGDAYQVDGTTVIPVAVVKGGGGGGGGEGTEPGGEGKGSGGGVGYGIQVRPLGVYEVRNGMVSWRPAVDVMRIILGGQLLALVVILAMRRRRRRRR
jgi:uncharacterized spore protein YtfJ